jgi:hypothetical protein
MKERNINHHGCSFAGDLSGLRSLSPIPRLGALRMI